MRNRLLRRVDERQTVVVCQSTSKRRVMHDVLLAVVVLDLGAEQ
jgi:hypothetical protein